MCIGSPSVRPPPNVPEAPRAPDVAASQSAGDRDKRRRGSATGEGRSTILTSSRGVQNGAATTTKTLLGT